MNKFALAAALLMVASPALAEDWDFMLINSTGKGIKAIEVSPAGAATWQANKLDPDVKREPVTKPGGKTTIHFNKGSGCKYDVKATFADDTSATWSGINVCDNAYVTLKYSAGAPTFTAS